MSKLTFDILREANTKRLPTFKNARGELAHNADGSDWSPNDWCVAVLGELGELANNLKKVRRGDIPDDEMPEMQAKIRKELADTQTYLDILAFRLGVDLGEATIEKFNEISKRVGSPITIDVLGPEQILFVNDARERWGA